MRKKVLLLFVLAASALSTFASVENANLGGAEIYLTCSFVRDRPISIPIGRAPMKKLTVKLIGNNLTIPSSLIGYKMVITSELGDVVFSDVTISTEIVIPEGEPGLYSIEFLGEDYHYFGQFTM